MIRRPRRTFLKARLMTLVVSSVIGFVTLTLHAPKLRAQEGDSKPAASASSGGGSAAKSPKKTSINFEDQLVEGQTQKPELFMLLQQRNSNFKRLIKLRENFLPEMRKTSEDVGRPSQGVNQGQGKN